MREREIQIRGVQLKRDVFCTIFLYCFLLQVGVSPDVQ